MGVLWLFGSSTYIGYIYGRWACRDFSSLLIGARKKIYEGGVNARQDDLIDEQKKISPQQNLIMRNYISYH